MDMDSNNRLFNHRVSYQTRLFFIIIVFTWVLTFSFFTLQYSREREYKIENVNDKLQLMNNRIIQMLDADTSIQSEKINAFSQENNLRITLINNNGKVLYDTNRDSVYENHDGRQEFTEALKNGTGYTVIRKSSTNNSNYFYSATRHNDMVVRTAIPYDDSLLSLLRVDTLYIWVIILIAIGLSIIAYFAAHRVALSVKNLREFARHAEQGTLDNYEVPSFPDDELGDISAHIINLYRHLEQATKERDASLKNLIFQEQEKNRIKYQLTNNINHELKTPIHAIQLCIETIIDNKDKLAKEEIVELANRSYSNIQRLSSLIQDITTITSLNDGSSQIEKKQIDIIPILDQIKTDVAELQHEKRMRINFDLPRSLIVQGNKGLIEAIFRNLVNNALNYSGGRDIFLKLIEETDTHYRFKFWDNGIGVAEEHLPRLFERFYRVDVGRSRKMGGTGLGLSIVKNAVLFHQGEISVKNRHNDGLEFDFTLHK